MNNGKYLARELERAVHFQPKLFLPEVRNLHGVVNLVRSLRRNITSADLHALEDLGIFAKVTKHGRHIRYIEPFMITRCCVQNITFGDDPKMCLHGMATDPVGIHGFSQEVAKVRSVRRHFLRPHRCGLLLAILVNVLRTIRAKTLPVCELSALHILIN